MNINYTIIISLLCLFLILSCKDQKKIEEKNEVSYAEKQNMKNDLIKLIHIGRHGEIDSSIAKQYKFFYTHVDIDGDVSFYFVIQSTENKNNTFSLSNEADTTIGYSKFVVEELDSLMLLNGLNWMDMLNLMKKYKSINPLINNSEQSELFK